MRIARTLGVGLAVWAGGLGIARGQVGGLNLVELFQQLDANGDLVIEKGEVPESGRPAFEELVRQGDKNKDGKIDREEYRALAQSLRGAGPAGDRFRAADKNNDGKLSREEFPGPPAQFDRIDADKDGSISREEANRVFLANPNAPGIGGAAVLERFKAMDKDDDGKVSRAEFTGPPERFDLIDADKDGFLSQAELGRAAAAGMERFRAMDRDGDGKISKDEWPGRAEVFERLDADKNGFVTPLEFRAIGTVQGTPKP